MLKEPLIDSGARSQDDFSVSAAELESRERISRWMGVAAMVIISIYTIATEEDNDSPAFLSRGTVWSVFSQLLLFAWCYGFDLKVWEKFGIDTFKLLDLKPPALDSYQMRHFASILSTFLAGIILLHKVMSSDNFLSPYPFATAFFVWIVIICLMLEARPAWSVKSPEGSVTDNGGMGIPFRSARWKWFTMLFSSQGVVGAAFGLTPISFFHTFVTDGMTSAALMMWNIEFSW
jgi:hypothetical protein